jgi:oligopeptide/dipeptide ABC transporter ATP-binding protein
MLRISALSAGYRSKSNYAEILRNIEMSLNKNEIIGVVGESGSGKTTLLKTIAGELYRSSGDIFYNDESIFALGNFKKFRSKRIYVRQDSMNILKPKYSVEFQIKKLFPRGSYNMSDIEWAFNHLHLPLEIMKKLPAQLSDGTRHRVVLAMAAIIKPEILLLDEPTTGLDLTGIIGFLELLKELKQHTSIIFVSSDVMPVFQICQRIYIMKNGMVLEDGKRTDIINNPHNPYTKDLVDFVPTYKNRHKVYSPVDNGVKDGCVFARNCRHMRAICQNEIPYTRDNEHGYRCIRYPGWLND